VNKVFVFGGVSAANTHARGSKPAAIIATATSASTMPIVCHRVTRSRSTTIASNTVAAGYSDISTPASDRYDACNANSIVTLAAGLSELIS
jgi:hypothetical protein